MLVLSRKLGEQIVIGNDIILTVVEVKGNQVRLGIDAPNQVCVLRAELGVWHNKPAGDDDILNPVILSHEGNICGGE